MTLLLAIASQLQVETILIKESIFFFCTYTVRLCPCEHQGCDFSIFIRISVFSDLKSMTHVNRVNLRKKNVWESGYCIVIEITKWP